MQDCCAKCTDREEGKVIRFLVQWVTNRTPPCMHQLAHTVCKVEQEDTERSLAAAVCHPAAFLEPLAQAVSPVRKKDNFMELLFWGNNRLAW